MTTFSSFMRACALLACCALAAPSGATPFSITAASFTAGTGYGTDLTEAAPTATLLDVRFSTASFTTQNFDLVHAGDFVTFKFGTVNFAEPNGIMGIIANETDNLGVTAKFTFAAPGSGPQTVVATGAAVQGSVSDNAIDYTLVWAMTSVAFGSGGIYDIVVSPLGFSNVGTQDANVRITLRTAAEVTAVPEPASVALFGVGLVGVAAWRRRRHAK